MKLKFTTALLLAFSQGAFAQVLTGESGLRFYDHHSSDMTGEAFGTAANGKQSGYDFVQRRYFSSIDSTTQTGAYANGEEANIDMIEHAGPFGTNGASMYLGFTSGTSSIWGGILKGNGTTMWMNAPGDFDFDGADDVTDLSSVWNDAFAFSAVAEARNSDIFIGKLRGGNDYVVIRCYNVHIPMGPPNGVNTDNVYFDFDYKASTPATGIAEASNDVLAVYPNPASDALTITLGGNKEAASVKFISILGEEVLTTAISGNVADVSSLVPGLYIMDVTTKTGEVLQKRIIKK